MNELVKKQADLRIRRGAGEDEPYFENFSVPFEPGQSVLDGLIWIRENKDSSLAIRYSCISANVCKECTMLVNGKPEYACMARLESGEMTLEPLKGKRVIRDLVTDTLPPRERLHQDR